MTDLLVVVPSLIINGLPNQLLDGTLENDDGSFTGRQAVSYCYDS